MLNIFGGNGHQRQRLSLPNKIIEGDSSMRCRKEKYCRENLSIFQLKKIVDYFRSIYELLSILEKMMIAFEFLLINNLQIFNAQEIENVCPRSLQSLGSKTKDGNWTLLSLMTLSNSLICVHTIIFGKEPTK